MRVRMTTGISGGRGDGTAWPDPGEVLDVDDDEGAALCAAGVAVPVVEEERAVEPPAAAAKAPKPAAKAAGK